jgi:hypothetical protein
MILAWININQNGLHTYGIELLTNSDNLGMLEHEIIQICLDNGCRYFVQGKSDRREKSNNSKNCSWLFIEFFGEGNQDRMLDVFIDFQNKFEDALYNNQILSNEPSTELLKQLKLWRI